MNWEGIHWIGWLKKGCLSTELLLIVRSSEPRRQNKFGIRDDQLFKLRSEWPTYDQLASNWFWPLSSISLSTTNIESRPNCLGGDKPLEIYIHSPVTLGASASSQIAQIQLVGSLCFEAHLPHEVPCTRLQWEFWTNGYIEKGTLITDIHSIMYYHR